MSDNSLILSMIAAIGLIGLILSPPSPHHPMGYVGCQSDGSVLVSNIDFGPHGKHGALLQIKGSCD